MRSPRTALLLYSGLTVLSIIWLVPTLTVVMTALRPFDEIRAGWWNVAGATFTLDLPFRAKKENQRSGDRTSGPTPAGHRLR